MPPQLTTRPYNRNAYVPGGAPLNVARAIQAKGYAQPGRNPIRVPVPGKKPTPTPPGTPGPGYWEDPVVPGQGTGDFTGAQPAGTYRGQQLWDLPGAGGFDQFGNPIDWPTTGITDWSKVTAPGTGIKVIPAPGPEWTGQAGPGLTGNPLGARPDVKALIEADPEVLGQIAARFAALNPDEALGPLGRSQVSFNAALRRAAINLGLGQRGMDTSVAGKFGSRIDADTLQQAINNKFSQNTQIQNQQDRAMSQAAANLAGRGLLSSGQASKTSGDINAQAEQNRYDALQAFLGVGEQGLSDLASQETEFDKAIAQARGGASGRAAESLRAWLQAQNLVDTQTVPPDTVDTQPLPPEITSELPTTPVTLPGAGGLFGLTPAQVSAGSKPFAVKPPKPPKGYTQHISTFSARPKFSYP